MKVKTLALDSIYSVGALGSKILLSFVSVPILLTYIGSEKFGIWMFLLSIVSFVSFFDAGITPTIKNKLTEAFSLGDEKEFKEYFQVGLLFSSIFIFLTFIGIFILSTIDIKYALGLNSNINKSEILLLCYVLLFITSSTLILSNVDNYFASKQLLGRIKLMEFAITTVSIMALYLAVKFKLNFALIAFIYSGQSIVVKYIFLYKLIQLDLSLFKIDKAQFESLLKKIKDIYIISLSFWGIKLCELVLTIVPSYLFVEYIGYTGIAEFNLIYRYASIPLFLFTATLPILWPVFTLKSKKMEFNWLRKIIKYVLGIILLGFLFFFIVSYFYGIEFLSYWTKGIIAVKFSYLFIVIFLCFSMCITYLFSTFLHSISDFKFELYCHVVIVVLTIASLLIFMRNKQIEIAVFGMGMAWIIGGFIPMYMRTIRFLKVKELTS